MISSSIIFLTSDCRQGTLLWMAATLSGLSGYMAAWNSVWTKPGIGKLSLTRSCVLPGTWGYSAHTNVAPNVSELLSPSLQKSSHSKLWGSVKPVNLVNDYVKMCWSMVICLVEGFGGTLCPDIDPIMMIWPSSILLETIESTLSWVHRQRAVSIALHTTKYKISFTEYIDIQHCSPRLHRAIPQCFRGAQTRIVNADINLK